MTDSSRVPLLVDDLFRRSAGEITAVLVRRLGGAHVETVEEAVQEAFIQALRVWPWEGVPSNPRGWLYRVARRRVLDARERGRRRSAILADAWAGEASVGASGAVGGGAGAHGTRGSFPDPALVADDELALLLLCCDPALPRISQVMLTLKVGCGFSVGEIAAAFLTRPAAVAQRLVRGKRRLREEGGRPIEATAALLEARAPVVREVLYLLFTGGHAAAEGGSAVRGELCGEALRLGRLVLTYGGDDPATRALLALFCLHAARLVARVDADGVARPLEEQDRGLWDRTLLAEGFHHLEESARGEEMTRYHLEAGIAAVHASAASSGETDWPRIVELYDRLLEIHPSPVVALNRAVALAEVRGAREGLNAVSEIAAEPALAHYHLLPAVVGALQERMGEGRRAAEHYGRALELAGSEADQAFLARRLARVAGPGTSG